MVNLPEGFDPHEHKRRANKFANQLPTRDNCDLADPREMFLWMLVAPPGLNGGQQAMPAAYNMLMSQHLYECGAMLTCDQCGHARDPAKVYVPPSAADPHWMTSPGRWVQPRHARTDTADPLDAAIDKLTNQQQAALLQRLQRRHKEGLL